MVLSERRAFSAGAFECDVWLVFLVLCIVIFCEMKRPFLQPTCDVVGVEATGRRSAEPMNPCASPSIRLHLSERSSEERSLSHSPFCWTTDQKNDDSSSNIRTGIAPERHPQTRHPDSHTPKQHHSIIDALRITRASPDGEMAIIKVPSR